MNVCFAKKLISCADNISELVIVPDGRVELLGFPAITMNQAAADRCIKAFNDQGEELPVDYEHSSVFEAGKGNAAPATAWIKDLRYEPERGLVGVLGDRSKEFDALVASKGYKYLSPVIKQDPDSGEINSIHSVALTNKPRIKKQKELLAASQRLTLAEMPGDDEEKNEEKPGETGSGDGFMDAIKKLAESLRGKGVQLPDESPEQVCNAAMQWMANSGGMTQTTAAYSEVVTVLGLDPKSEKTLVLAEINKLKGHVGYVPAADFKALSDRLGVIESERKAADAESAVTLVLNEGKLNPNDADQMKWAREFAAKDVAGFRTIMASAPVVHPVGGRVTPDSAPANKDDKSTREKVIALADREYADNAVCKRISTRDEWVNNALRDAGFASLKDSKN